jgi:C_GCAxxG_C_C family probable redox protein
LAVAESQGIQSEFLPQVATGFCSGFSRTGGICGALNGAVMALGLLGGRSQAGAPVDGIYQRVQTLVQRFEAQFGAIDCHTLTGCHLGTDEGQASYRATNQKEKCLDYVAEVTRMVLELAGSG